MNHFQRNLSLGLLLFAWAADAQPVQREQTVRVALFVPEGAELLDFAGPGEVFSNADFETYIIGFTEEPFVSQGFLKVVPNYSYKNCPKPDVIVIPGGGGNQFYQHTEALDWIRAQSEDALLLTVCTGAHVAARAGKLDSLRVTTHYSGYESLEKACPSCVVLRDARFVDNDRVITTSGISAGIDGALHLVARIRGPKVAEAVAHYMMYDKWNPEAGLVAREPAFIRCIRKEGLLVAKEKFARELSAGYRPFAGELCLLARERANAKDYPAANAVLDFAVSLYPYDQGLFEELGSLYKTLGKYAPPTQDEFVDLLLDEKIEEAVAVFNRVKTEYPHWIFFKESAINWAGYVFLRRQKPEMAIRVFQMNVEAYPDSFNVYDSLAEACLKAGQRDKAIAHYKKSLEINPDNKNAQKALASLEQEH